MYKLRELESDLVKQIEKRQITILLGARQTGKTFLLKRIKEISSYKTLFIDLDIYENRQIFASYSEAINYLKFNGYKDKERFVLFLDEFHTVRGIEKVFKNLYDNHPEIKIFATGSSSLEVIKYLKESLAGRKSIYYLYPLTFQEFIMFKDDGFARQINDSTLDALPKIIVDKLTCYIKEFCIFGGYPDVVLSENDTEKKEILRSIFDLFVKKDLIEFLNIKNPQSALDILRYLALNIGQIINYSNLCSTNHIDINTLKRYLHILQETFIIKTIPPFFTNKNKEIVKAPKIYFYDMGARNYFIKDWTFFDLRMDNGFLSENFIFSQLQKKKDYWTEIKYWRDKNGREVDFIVQKDKELMAYEVKSKTNIKRKDLANLFYFKNLYKEAQLFLVNIESGENLWVDNLKTIRYL
ncbi:MAG: ATP-binding protein [bacterium]|nr:ATP-binding protein [bacterium]